MLSSMAASQRLEREQTMETEKTFFDACDWCGKSICYGNALVTVNRNIEQVDEDDNPSGSVITVIQAEPLLTLCAECGNRLDDEVLRDLLKPTTHEALKAQRGWSQSH